MRKGNVACCTTRWQNIIVRCSESRDGVDLQAMCTFSSKQKNDGHAHCKTFFLNSLFVHNNILMALSSSGG